MSDYSVRLAFEVADRATQPIGRVTGTLKRISKDVGLDGAKARGDAAGGTGRRAVKRGGVAREIGGAARKIGRQGTEGLKSLMRAFFGAANDFDSYMSALEEAEKSSEKAKAAFDWTNDFLLKTPFQLNEIVDAYRRLRTLGLDPTNGSLQALGDASAATNTTLAKSVDALEDALGGKNDRLRKLGIFAQTKGQKITYKYKVDGKWLHKEVKKGDQAAIGKTITEILNEKYAGSMEGSTKSWQGRLTKLRNYWTRFVTKVMGSGLFQWMNDRLGDVLSKIDALAESGTLDEWADIVGKTILEAFKEIWHLASELGRALLAARDHFGSWKPILAAAAAVIAGPFLWALTKMFGKVDIIDGVFLWALNKVSGKGLTGVVRFMFGLFLSALKTMSGKAGKGLAWVARIMFGLLLLALKTISGKGLAGVARIMFGLLLLALKTVFGKVGKGLTGLLKIAGRVLLGVVKAVLRLAFLLLVSRIAWILAAIGGVAYLIYDNWDWVVEKLRVLWDELKIAALELKILFFDVVKSMISYVSRLNSMLPSSIAEKLGLNELGQVADELERMREEAQLDLRVLRDQSDKASRMAIAPGGGAAPNGHVQLDVSIKSDAQTRVDSIRSDALYVTTDIYTGKTLVLV